MPGIISGSMAHNSSFIQVHGISIWAGRSRQETEGTPLRWLRFADFFLHDKPVACHRLFKNQPDIESHTSLGNRTVTEDVNHSMSRSVELF